MRKSALFIIDMQNKFFNDKKYADSLSSAVEYVNAAIALFREKELPIFVIQHKDEQEHLVEGTSDFEVAKALNLEPRDTRVIKTYNNSFTKTGLAEKLRQLGVDTIVLAGFCAEYCVLSTYKGAQDLDLTPIILRNAIASGSAEHIRFVEEITETITYGALRTLL